MCKYNIGVCFKKALSTHIPKSHILYPAINVHTTKLSYSTMPSMGSKIGAHNKKVEKNNEAKKETRDCSCPKTKKGKPFSCPWEGTCLQEGLIYKCEGIDTNSKETKWEYLGCTGAI